MAFTNNTDGVQLTGAATQAGGQAIETNMALLARRSLAGFVAWSSSQTYQTNDHVRGSDGRYFISVINSNLNHDPTTDNGTNWLEGPIRGTVSKLTISNGTVSPYLQIAGAASLTNVPNSIDELRIANNTPGNVVAFCNLNSAGTSAVTFRDNTNTEKGAVGYGNSVASTPFTGANYFQSWSDTTAPSFRITLDGNYGPVGSSFRFYNRLDLDPAGLTTVFKPIPWGNSQSPAFQIQSKLLSGTAAFNYVKVVADNGDNGIQFFKDATPTKAWAVGQNVPGSGSLVDDLIFAAYNGTSWAEKARITNTGSVLVGAAAIATTATDGFLYIPTCAGTPTGTPTTFTGRMPLVYDSTNHKLYVYDGGWKTTTTFS